MYIYAYALPQVPDKNGWLKIGQTEGHVEKRIKDQLSQVSLTPDIVLKTSASAGKRNITDHDVHRLLAERGFERERNYDEKYSEWFKCSACDVQSAIDFLKQKYINEDKRNDLTEKFYTELRNWYFWATEEQYQGLIAGREPDPDHALRIIVRLLLIFFLKEQGLVPQELFEEDWIKENLHDDEHGYYNAILRNLFFYSLNTPQNDREDHLENRKLIRHYGKVKEQLHKKIPFLNGGLFNEHPGDDFALSNKYFFSGIQTVSIDALGDRLGVKGLINILKEYKYTLDETEDASFIDPEFIGKIFESLLACIEADNKESRRKVTGSYYTPREIVEYMVDEALNAYLESANHASEENLLLRCTILDPACGSGAFPCGVMNVIMNRIDPQKTLTQSERYAKKLEIVRNVIYGVDIQPMAVQIAILRLFLSLLQEITPTKDARNNFGIEPLPNLDYKFVVANTLLGIDYKSFPLGIYDRYQLIFRQVVKLKEDYFREYQAAEKNRKRERINDLEKELADNINSDEILALCEWGHSDTSPAPYFDPRWMFGVEKFAIVIGNPPYRQLQKEGGTLAKQYERCCYETFAKTGDIYSLFYERGWQLLAEGGHLCFITSNKWMRAEYGESLRKFLSEKTNPKLLLDFAGMRVFTSSSPDVNILLFSKEENRHQTSTGVVQRIEDLVTTSHQKMMAFSHSPWVILSPIERQIMKKIEAAGKPMKDWNVQIYRGILTGFNDAFIIDGTKKAELIAVDPKCAEIIQPILRGRDIRRYGYEFADLWLINTHNGNKEKGIEPVHIEDYPVIKRHLDSYYLQLEKRTDKGETPYNLRSCAYLEDFEKPKLLWAETMRIRMDRSERFPRFSYTEDSIFTDKTCFFATGKDLLYITAILNSAVGRYQLSQTVSILDNGGYLMQKMYVEQVFVCNPSLSKKKSIAEMAKSISCESNEAAIDRKESALDKLVFDMYGLSEEEIRFVQECGSKPLIRTRLSQSGSQRAVDAKAVTNQKTTSFSSSPWVVLTPLERGIREKIEAIGKPLKDWNVQINFGIKTGFNDAFIIDGAKKADLIAKDSKSAEIIRPILRGRDIKRYRYEFADLWMLFIPWHFPLHEDSTIQGTSRKAENAFKKKYPAVYQHLLTYKNELSNRNKSETGIRYEWYVLQRWAANYWEDFEKPKIIYPDIMRMPRNEKSLDDYPYFYYDAKNFYPEATNFVMTGKDIDLIFLFLASDVGFYVFTKFYTGPLFDETGFRYKKAYMNELFVPLFDKPTAQKLRKAIKNLPASRETVERIIEDFCDFDREEIEAIRMYKKRLLVVEKQTQTKNKG